MQIIRAFFVIFLVFFSFFRQNTPFMHMRDTIYLRLFLFVFVCLCLFSFYETLLLF